MVRKEELKGTSVFTQLVAQVIRNKVKAKGITQLKLSELIHKSKSYVNTRFNGLESWTLDDLDNIAAVLGYENAFTIFDLARGLDPTQSKQQPKPQVREPFATPKETEEQIQQTESNNKEYDSDYIVAHWKELGLAALYDPNKEIESETPLD